MVIGIHPDIWLNQEEFADRLPGWWIVLDRRTNMFRRVYCFLRLKPPSKLHVVHYPMILNIARRVWIPMGPFLYLKCSIWGTNSLTTYWQLSFQHSVLVSFLASTWHIRMCILIAKWMTTCSLYVYMHMDIYIYIILYMYKIIYVK